MRFPIPIEKGLHRPIPNDVSFDLHPLPQRLGQHGHEVFLGGAIHKPVVVRVGVVFDERGPPGAQRAVDKDLDATDGEQVVVRAFHASAEEFRRLGNRDGGVNPVGHEPIVVDHLH